MSTDLLISYLGPDRSGLIAEVTGFLHEKGGNIGDLTFAMLGGGAELFMIMIMPDEITIEGLKKELRTLPKLANGEVRVEKYRLKGKPGPSSRITHRIILAGPDRPGLCAKITKVLDEHGANIVRMNSETLQGAGGEQNISRVAVAMREERAPDCLAAIVKIAGELKLTFRYETA